MLLTDQQEIKKLVGTLTVDMVPGGDMITITTIEQLLDIVTIKLVNMFKKHTVNSAGKESREDRKITQ